MKINNNKKIVMFTMLFVVLITFVIFDSNRLGNPKDGYFSAITFPAGVTCGNSKYTCNGGEAINQQEQEIPSSRTVRRTRNLNDRNTVVQNQVCYFDTWTCSNGVEEIGCIDQKIKMVSFGQWSNCKCLTNCDFPLEVEQDGTFGFSQNGIFGFEWTF